MAGGGVTGLVAGGGVAGFEGVGAVSRVTVGSFFGGGGGGDRTRTPPVDGGGAWAEADCASAGTTSSRATITREIRRTILAILPHG